MPQRLRYGIRPNIYSEYFLVCALNKPNYYSSNRFSYTSIVYIQLGINFLGQQILHTGGQQPYFLNPHPTDGQLNHPDDKWCWDGTGPTKQFWPSHLLVSQEWCPRFVVGPCGTPHLRLGILRQE